MIDHFGKVMAIRYMHCIRLVFLIFAALYCIYPVTAYAGQEGRVFLWSIESEKKHGISPRISPCSLLAFLRTDPKTC